MKFVLVAIILAAVVAVILLLLICCFRRYAEQCAERRRPQALHFEDDLSRKHLLEEGEEEPLNPRSPSQKRLPAHNRYFVLGGHRFEATSSGYRQIDDDAAYNASEAQKLALNADDSSVNVYANHEDMIGSDDNPKPRKTRHPLAIQFSAMAHAAEVTGDASLEPNATRQFLHETKPSDNYVWPSRGGPASPIHVEWGQNAHVSAPKEQSVEGQNEAQDSAAAGDDDDADKDESVHMLAMKEQLADEVALKEDSEEHQEHLVKTDQHIVPKPKSKKGKKRQPQLPIEQLET